MRAADAGHGEGACRMSAEERSRSAFAEAPIGSARSLADRVRRGEISAVEIAERTLAALETHEPDLHAMVALEPSAVIRQAQERDAGRAAGRPGGPLEGVPFAVKDIADTFDLPTRHGSPIHVANRPSEDALVVSRMRRAGALIIGKSVTTEFACFQPGPTRNPFDLDRTPGGSSSGSAALVGAGIVPLALATQTAGSVIRPAAFCGAVGVKPSFGILPRDGILSISPSLDTVGIIASDVRDAAVALGVMAGDLARFDPAIAVGLDAQRPVRLGWWPGTAPAELEDGIEAALRSALEGLDAGPDVVVEDIELPSWFGELLEAQIVLMREETLQQLERELREHPGLVSDSLHAFLAPGPDPDGARRARTARDRALPLLDAVFARHDLIVTPAAPGVPPMADTTGSPDFCRTWTLLGTPAVVLPGVRGPGGLPLGLQLVGPRDDDARTLALAVRVESALLAAAGAR